MSQLQLLTAATNPFGRCNRTGLWRITCILLAAQILIGLGIWLTGSSFTGPLAFVCKLGFVWVGFCALSKRLHDIGLSAWWVPAVFVLMLAWTIIQTFVMLALFGAQMLVLTGPVFWLSAASTVTPAIATAIWLHCANGEEHSNRYGPPPSELGFSSSQNEVIVDKAEAVSADT